MTDNPTSVLGLDIGGANLKAWAGGIARSRPFALWRDPDGLAAALRETVVGLPEAGAVVATMTGELCDCFPSRKAGVERIAASVGVAFPGKRVLWYGLDGVWRTPPEAAGSWEAVAAANWHAIGRAAGALLPGGTGLVIDIGSTTTDVIPVRNGRVLSGCRSDRERMERLELVYTGLLRTPVCGIVPGLEVERGDFPVAREWFATMADVRVVLGEWPEAEDDCDTPDGRPLDRFHSLRRLARCWCSEPGELGESELMDRAARLALWQEMEISRAIGRQASVWPECSSSVLVCGIGESLAVRCAARELPRAVVTQLSEAASADVSAAAGAWSLARIASAEFGTNPGECPEPRAARLGGRMHGERSTSQ